MREGSKKAFLCVRNTNKLKSPPHRKIGSKGKEFCVCQIKVVEAQAVNIFNTKRNLMYLSKTPPFIQNLFPNFVWKVDTEEKELFLTFDDGPVPEITEPVLELLNDYDAQATFFCVGENIVKHPDTFRRVLAAGHQVGNHTFNHLNGWATENIPYFHNVRHCAKLVKSDLFRPPYGKLKRKQAQFLQRHYAIVMWDVLSGDFDPNKTADQCFQSVVQHAKRGSIIVFHDSMKSKNKLLNILPRVLDHFSELGYQFKALTPTVLHRKRLSRIA